MKKKGLLIVMLLVCVMSLMLGGCFWPSQTTKEKIDTSLTLVTVDNTDCQAGDCNACKDAIAEADSTISYVKENSGWSSSAAKSKLKTAAGVASEYYRRCLNPKDANDVNAICQDCKTGSQKCYLILKWLRSYGNGGEGANE